MSTEKLGKSSAFAKRLKILIESRFDGRQANFARAIGMSTGALSDYLSGRNLPTFERLALIIERTQVSADWLLTGQGPMFKRKGGMENQEGVLEVPVLNVELAAGHGAHPPEIEEARETRPFREADLRRLSTHPANLTIVQVSGTSMEPLLHAGDEVMVDFTAPITLRDGLYALRLGDALLIKHVQRLTGGRIALRSENPIYEPIEIDLAQEPDDFQVLGRVLWGARRY